tara:strand:- start:42691 stop:42915 length:225 start_codon:yes stop_codon:yes gene_type:complete
MSTNKVWIVYHGSEYGDREDCSIFYTPTEIYDSKSAADQRANELKALQKQNGGPFYVDIQEIEMGKKADTDYMD